MGILATCPPAAALPNVPIPQCLESVGQIQKIVFQRKRKADGTRNKWEPNHATTATDPTLKADWDVLLAATDSTKAVQSPFLNQPENEPGAPRTYGGGNATLGGVEIITGREASSFTGQFLRQSQDTIKALKKFQQEEIGVYFIDEFGRIILDSNGEDSASTTLEFYPFDIYGLFIGDKKLGGLEEPDMNSLQFNLLPNWSDDLRIVTPADFDALNDLITPA